MANTTFSGPVRSQNGFQSIGPGSTVDLTLATDLTVAAHAGRVVTMDPAATPTAITLPTINATANSAVAGDNDPNNPNTVGTTFEIFFKDNFTGSIATDGTDKFVGSVMIGVDDGAKKHLYLQQQMMLLTLMEKQELVMLLQVVLLVLELNSLQQLTTLTWLKVC